MTLRHRHDERARGSGIPFRRWPFRDGPRQRRSAGPKVPWARDPGSGCSRLRQSPAAVWPHVLDTLLAASSIVAVYVASCRVVTRRMALLVSAWAALLGSSVVLISHVLGAYTSAVAWGLASSLAASAAACLWVQKRSPPSLLFLSGFAILALLSKPEFGLAALAVLATSLGLSPPSRRFGLAALGIAVSLSVLVVLRVTPETLAAAWRGYSGYDQIATGTVGVVAPRRLFGSLLAAGAVGTSLWWATRLRSYAAAVTLLVVFALVMRLTEDERFLHAASILTRISWVGIVPALLWIGWTARHAALPQSFWILWVYSLTVSLRWFCLGSFQTWAAGTVALLFCLLVQHVLLHRPTRPGWLVLATFLLLSSVETELDAWRRPKALRSVDTTLGTVRVPAGLAENLEWMRTTLNAAPDGGLFVSGGGPGWYLLSRPANPTRFDVLYTGIGTTEPEASEILADLRANPPGVVLFERDFRNAERFAPRSIDAAIGLSESPPKTSPNGRWTTRLVDDPALTP